MEEKVSILSLDKGQAEVDLLVRWRQLKEALIHLPRQRQTIKHLNQQHLEKVLETYLHRGVEEEEVDPQLVGVASQGQVKVPRR